MPFPEPFSASSTPTFARDELSQITWGSCLREGQDKVHRSPIARLPFIKMVTVADIVQVPFNVFVLLLLFPALLIDLVSCVCRWVCCLLAILLHGALSGDLVSTVKFLVVSQLSGVAQAKVTERMADVVAAVKS